MSTTSLCNSLPGRASAMGRYGLKTAQKASQFAELPDREILMSRFSAEGDALQGLMGLKRFLLDIKSTKGTSNVAALSLSRLRSLGCELSETVSSPDL
ncbi:hypothetical protein OUZ56_026229 [Daphnia magna]|uniref:Uncharacterized protein n=1 Tax=Daphnia magna TaxID=35525 RepID=A0ABQ9ZL85_9CRUS|nr:hypothetical protein OUZ56_026229 [Daphnia magna]